MKIRFLWLLRLLLYIFYVEGTPDNEEHEDAWLTVPEIIVKYGYPFELHEVTTKDGYILSVHRIPQGKNMKPHSGHGSQSVIWLQHGLLGDSSNFIMNRVDKAQAYVLADAGYDVWLGNARGNSYSKKHVSLSPDDDEFWDFSWHEMGLYDVPAVLNYILKATHQSSIYYSGHSMGTTMMYVALSEHPQLNKKIRLFNCLAPIAYVTHMKTPLLRFILPFINEINWILYFFGVKEFLPSNTLLKTLETRTCDETNSFEGVCENLIFLIAGYDEKEINKTMLPMILGHLPSGTSVRTILHYGQCVKSGKFQKYDFGGNGNMKHYGQKEAPSYDLSKVLAPTALYWGENDWLGPPEDVAQTASELGNVVRNYRINFDMYNHMDFLWAVDNKELLNRPLIKFMESY